MEEVFFKYKMNITSLSVIVPCYNEENNIPLIVKRFNEIKPGDCAELILVDNGSTDESNKIIRKLCKKYSYIRLVHVKKNVGYGFGIWSGLRKAKGEILCWTHADLQTDIKDTITAFNVIKQQYDCEKCYVKGNRKHRPFLDIIFTAPDVPSVEPSFTTIISFLPL